MRYDSGPRRSGIKRLTPVELVAIAMAALVVGALAVTWAVRLPYPYDLEWMEGGMLAHAWRLLQGEALYVRPGPDFAPFVYPPGYSVVLAALGAGLGLSPGLGRAVSLAGTLAAAAAVYVGVVQTAPGREPARDRLIGALAAATFLGCYPYGGAFYDLVRPDGLMVGLLGWSVVLALRPGDARIVGSGLLLFLAGMVKQNALFFAPALLVLIGLRDGRRSGLRFSLSAGVPTLLAFGALQLWTGGLFGTYLFVVPLSHEIVWSRLLAGAAFEMAQALPLTTALVAIGVLWRSADASPDLPSWRTIGAPMLFAALGCVVLITLRPVRPGFPADAPSVYLGLAAFGALAAHFLERALRRGPRPSPLFAGCAALGATAWVVATWMRGHSGGFVNVLIPYFWVASLGAGMMLVRLHGPVRSAATALIALQLGLQGWNTPHGALRPTEADVATGDRIVGVLKRVDGPVWSPFAAWLPTYAGHAPQVHSIALSDLDVPGGPLQPDAASIAEAIAARHWGAVVTSKHAIGYGLAEHYTLRTRLHLPGDALVPKTGWRVELHEVLVPD